MPQTRFTFPSQLLVPLSVVLLLIIAIATGGRQIKDADGRPVVVYAHPPCPPDLMVYFERAFEDFRKTHPEINLKVLHITGQYEDKVKIMFAGNVAPDVIFTYPQTFPAWVNLDTLTPLDELMRQDGRISKHDFFEAGIETFSWRGQLYGLPKDASADLLFYNKDMFHKLGLDEPDANWTWDDFLAAAKAMTVDQDADGRTDVFGARQPGWDRMVIQNGGKVISDDGQRCLLDQPEAIEALKWWAELRTKHGATPTPESEMDNTIWTMFATGKVGMFISMYPGVPILRRSCDFQWDIALVPKGRANRYAAYTGSALAITQQSHNKQAAFTFVRWMTTVGMKHVMTFDIPAYKKLGQSDAWRDAALPPASKFVAVDIMADAGPPSIKHPAASEITDTIRPYLDRVTRGVSTVEQVVTAIVPKVNTILKRHAAKADSEPR